MAKAKNHSTHHKNRKDHRNGIKKPQVFPERSLKGMYPPFVKNQRFALKASQKVLKKKALSRLQTLREHHKKEVVAFKSIQKKPITIKEKHKLLRFRKLSKKALIKRAVERRAKTLRPAIVRPPSRRALARRAHKASLAEKKNAPKTTAEAPAPPAPVKGVKKGWEKGFKLLTEFKPVQAKQPKKAKGKGDKEKKKPKKDETQATAEGQ